MNRDDGNASIEFLALAVVLLVPLVYALLFAFQLQRAAFATTAAAREAGRAYVTADADAEDRAHRAADLALHDQMPGEHAATTIDATPGEVTVEVTVVVELPLAGRWARVPVTATHVATPERYRSR